MAVCDRHDEVVEVLDDHEVRIRDIEINNATMGQNIIGLTDSVKDLVWWVKVAVIGLVSLLAGFAIWAIQYIIT